MASCLCFEKTDRIRSICSVVLVSKIIIFIIAWCAAPSVPESLFDEMQVPLDYCRFPTAIRKFAAFDAGWYLSLVDNSYKNSKGAAAFYPLWPFLLRTFGCANNPWAPVISAGLSAVFWCSGIGLIFVWVSKEFSHETAWWILLANLLLPSSMTYWLGFTESLFVLLFAAFLRYANTEKYWITLLAALLLPLVRPVGIFVISLPLIWWFVGLRRSRSMYCVMVFLAGWLSYFSIMWFNLGSPMAGWDAQKYHVNQPSLYYIFDIPKLVDSLFYITSFHDPKGSLLDRTMFVVAFWCICRLWRFRPSWCLVSILMLLVPAMTNQFLSFSRFTIVVIPLLFPMAELLSKIRRFWLTALIGGLLLVQYYLIDRFFRFEWAT